jgi:hypothetical protein
MTPTGAASAAATLLIETPMMAFSPSNARASSGATSLGPIWTPSACAASATSTRSLTTNGIANGSRAALIAQVTDLSGAFDDDARAADLLQDYEAKIAALERMVGRQALEIEFLKGALKSAPRSRSASTSVITGPVASPSPKDAG